MSKDDSSEGFFPPLDTSTQRNGKSKRENDLITGISAWDTARYYCVYYKCAQLNLNVLQLGRHQKKIGGAPSQKKSTLTLRMRPP